MNETSNSVQKLLFNFLDPKLSPSVTCKSPVTENYEVTNLISENISQRNLGFIAYPSIKPPVEIEFKFICPINIHYIMLKTSVGSQKSTGIQVMAKNDSLDYTHLSKSVFNQTGLILCNSKIYSKERCPKNYDKQLHHLAYFDRSSFKAFLTATSLKIIIFRTERSVPCLGAIEVWGIPARCCSKVTKETVTKIMTKKEKNISIQGTNEARIPDDFKDDLTYELMSVPITLPSGKTVDQSTLDKHIANEIIFSRKACDPFTGIKFTEKVKPILNVALKSRIDMFMIQNHYNNINCKRLLGRGNVHSESEHKKSKITATNDLDEAIAAIKDSPSFINITSDTVKSNKCVSCHKNYEYLYEILCQHFYCRTCLTDILDSSKCSICEKCFCKKDIQKVNL